MKPKKKKIGRKVWVLFHDDLSGQHGDVLAVALHLDHFMNTLIDFMTAIAEDEGVDPQEYIDNHPINNPPHDDSGLDYYKFVEEQRIWAERYTYVE